MPTYEYVCKSCRHYFEKVQGMNEEPLSSCPECAGTIKRLITGGSGFIVKNGCRLETCDCDFKTPGCGRDSICHAEECS